jgi:signal transduction histidine kinase
MSGMHDDADKMTTADDDEWNDSMLVQRVLEIVFVLLALVAFVFASGAGRWIIPALLLVAAGYVMLVRRSSKQAHERVQALAAIDLLPVGVLVFNRQGDCIITNEFMRERFPRDEERERTISGEIPIRLMDFVPFFQAGRVAQEVLDEFADLFSNDIERKNMSARLQGAYDGSLRTYQIEVVRVYSHATPLIILIANDVTTEVERQEHESALQNELLYMERQAGKAEMASGMLHDVGNVLTSIALAADLGSEKIKRFPRRVIEELPAAFDAVVAGRAEQRDFGGMVHLLRDRLQGNFTDMDELFERLQRHCTFAKAIIADQQDRTQRVFLRRRLDIEAVVDDAMQIALDARDARSWIEVEKTIEEPACDIQSDTERLKQVLVNLLRNAIDAVADFPVTKVRIRGEVMEQWYRISVRDFGPGVAPEHVPQLFRHGFTTKDDGHGFGLHHAANVARELQGSIRYIAHEIGAEFEVEIPLVATKNQIPAR